MTAVAVSSNIGTVTLNGKIKTFSVDEGICSVALKLVSGDVYYTGTLPLTADDNSAIPSTPELLDSSGFEFVTQNPIDGFIVDATAGVVIIAFIKG